MSKKSWIALLLLLAIVNVVAYWPTNLYFLNDDFVHIPLTDYDKFFQNNSIRPLHELLVKMDLIFWGKQAFGFHITQLLLHFIVCIQLFFLTRVIQMQWLQVQKSIAEQVAFFSVALFLIYPQHAEALAWVLGRTPVLSAIFFIATLQLFFNKKFACYTYVLGAFFFAATLFTYEQSILLPMLFFWLAFIEKQPALRKNKFVYAVVTSIAAIVYVIARKIITSDIVGTYEGGNFVTFNIQHLLANTGKILLRLFINPSATKYFIYTTIIVSSIAATLLFYQRKNLTNKAFIFFIAIIGLLILPIISLGVTIRSFESSRYLYLPAIFIAMALAMFLQSQKKKNKIIPLLLVLLIAYWSLGKIQSAIQYKQASNYVQRTNQSILQHFKTSSDTLTIDTLHLTINRLPVYRVGFKSGIYWLAPTIDTNKIVVKYYHDEFINSEKK